MICKIYIFWKFIQDNIHWDKTQHVKKNSFGLNKRYKKNSFFFHELQLITVLLLIPDSYTNWCTRLISLKLCVGFSIFDSVSYFFKVYIFFQQKAWTLWLWNVKIPFKIKSIEKSFPVLLQDIWLICNKKFENSMISGWVGAPRKLTWRQTF